MGEGGGSRAENKRMSRLTSLLRIMWALFMCLRGEVSFQSGHPGARIRQEVDMTQRNIMLGRVENMNKTHEKDTARGIMK